MSRSQSARFLWTSVSFALLLTTLLLAVFLLVVPKLVGALPLTILSGSMRPTMTPGTLVVVQPVDPGEVGIGDVVTYQATSDDPVLITHRVTEVTRHSDGEMQFALQGDNNDAPDEPVEADQVRGKVIYTVPYFGWVTNKLNAGDGPQHTRWAAYALLTYGTFMLLWGTVSRIRAPRPPATHSARLRRPSQGCRRGLAEGGAIGGGEAAHVHEPVP
jgi:signal peptidase